MSDGYSTPFRKQSPRESEPRSFLLPLDRPVFEEAFSPHYRRIEAKLKSITWMQFREVQEAPDKLIPLSLKYLVLNGEVRDKNVLLFSERLR